MTSKPPSAPINKPPSPTSIAKHQEEKLKSILQIARRRVGLKPVQLDHISVNITTEDHNNR